MGKKRPRTLSHPCLRPYNSDISQSDFEAAVLRATATSSESLPLDESRSDIFTETARSSSEHAHPGSNAHYSTVSLDSTTTSVTGPLSNCCSCESFCGQPWCGQEDDLHPLPGQHTTPASLWKGLTDMLIPEKKPAPVSYAPQDEMEEGRGGVEGGEEDGKTPADTTVNISEFCSNDAKSDRVTPAYESVFNGK